MTIDLPELRIDRIPHADFRSLMCSFPTGVSVVTTVDGEGEPRGMTCSSVCSVSLDPPILLVCLRNGSPTLSAVLDRMRFAVNLLHERAQPTAELFASGRSNRFDLARWKMEPGWGGPDLVHDAHSVAHCEVTTAQPIGDHTVVFGQVYQVSLREGEGPLLYGMRRYAAWSVFGGPYR